MKSIVIAGRLGKAAELRRTQGGDPLSRMRFAPLPPVETLRELVSYDPDTGKLTWNFRKRSFFTSDREYLRWNNRYAGKAAFAYKTRGGYLSGAIFKRLYLAHRVAWKIYTGDEPGLILDHINGDRTDNRIANLREATFEQNVGNRFPNADSTSRYRGVAWCKRDKRWIAYCASRVIGRFQNETEAAAAYNTAAIAHYGEFAKINIITGDPA